MKIIDCCLKVGAERPFSVLHLSDTHLTYADEREPDNGRKIKLAKERAQYFQGAQETLAQAEADPRMIRISGSDFHQIPDLARGGIVTDRDVRTNADLLACLRSGEYELITIDL